MLSVEDGMRQRDCEDLVRPERRVIAVFAIDDIVKAPAALVPETAVKGLPRQFGMTGDLVGFGMARVAQPLGQQRKRVVSELDDLDRLNAAWRHYPIADLGIHPGPPVNLGSLQQQAGAPI